MMKDRRTFIKDIATISIGVGLARSAFAEGKDKGNALKKQNAKVRDFGIQEFKPDPNGLRIGYVGCAGKGAHNLNCFYNIGQKAVAFCDVDSSDRVPAAMKKAGNIENANVLKDYRKFFDKMHREMDAVAISTADVSHFGIAMTALEYGLPIYVEKPMCHSIGQIRAIVKKAREVGVATQMGNQSHSSNGIHICNEWIKAGLIGKVHDVVIWTDRPYRGGTSIVGKIVKLDGWSKEIPVPETLDWNSWLSTTSVDPYREMIHPSAWRCWWKYGSGALGDIGCHMLDIPVFSLDLKMPVRVKARQRLGTSIHCAQQEVVEYYFDKTNQGVPLKISWHSGYLPKSARLNLSSYDESMLPFVPKEFLDTGRTVDSLADNGMFIIGDKGVIYSPTMHLSGTPALLPKEKYLDLKNSGKLPPPEVRYEKGNHWLNFVKAVRGEEKASSNFDYAGKLTEIVQLGNLALRSGSNIEWDAENMICRGNPTATALVTESLRSGWY